VRGNDKLRERKRWTKGRRADTPKEQIAFVLKQTEPGTPISEVCRKLGIAEQTFYRWTSKYGGMPPSDRKRLRQLEKGNAKLKKLVADLSLDKRIAQDVRTKNPNACRKTGRRTGSAGTLPGERTQKLLGTADQSGMAPEATDPGRADLFTNADQGDRLCEETIWISKDPCPAAARRVKNQPQADLQAVQRRRTKPAGRKKISVSRAPEKRLASALNECLCMDFVSDQLYN